MRPGAKFFLQNLEPSDPGLELRQLVLNQPGERGEGTGGGVEGVCVPRAGAAEQITQLRNTAHFNTTFNKGESLSICLTITSCEREREEREKRRRSYGAAGIPFVFSR